MKQYLRYVVYLTVFIVYSSARAAPVDDFFRAVGVDNALTVQELLSRGFDPNAISEKGQPALYLAMLEGSSKVATALLADARIKIDAPNASDESPLMAAALRGRLQWAQHLIDRGAQLNRSGWTPLHYAAAGPEPQVVALCLDKGAVLEARSPNGTTALMMAARYGAEGSVDLLLARGANLQARNVQGLTAADFANLGGRERLASRLAAAAR